MCPRCNERERYKNSGWCLFCINESRRLKYEKSRLLLTDMTPEQLEERKRVRQARAKKFREENPERAKEIRIKSPKKRAREIKQAVWNIYNSRCACCQVDDPEILELDHINGGGTRERLNGRRHFQLWRDISNGKEDLNKYQLLCGNCHKRKTKGLECLH